MTDYFVIASAETVIQVRAIVEGITEALAAWDVLYSRREGLEDARWILLDFGDVVVHVLQQAEREYYDLERLWGDAPQLRVSQSGELIACEMEV